MLRSGSPRRKLRLPGSAQPPVTAEKRSFLPQTVSVLTAITAVLAIVISWLTLRMNRDAQFSTRYTSAVEQFGNGNELTRTGGIYLLGRLAVESSDDRSIIIDMLTDYVKQKTGLGNADPAVCHTRSAPAPDVVAALRVLFFRIGREPGDKRIDLRRVCLVGVEMPGADLTCVRLDQSVIRSAVFDNAKLVDASLEYVSFAGSSLIGADLTRAVAFGADFTNVNTYGRTDLTGARLREAELAEAKLAGADLTGADLTRARLDDADLTDADVSGARLATYLGRIKHLPPGADRSGALASATALAVPDPARVCA
ncbi:pentapeptide repeat-containing protein [Actinoplanes sp. Pm04-4]|uniref:Pentapeptide repeat-containing protein n=1 Tax=Paractinoplanes pyxinae TaxID=2997416 RepID=A0ABT4BCM3_9ACTN|nr:pentapeptide repeat-containing protein [Actinoplanes pyxinae]MCY1144269.1 pentapeptide repeat-containing protein [Actinoplanes pyxinae]